MAGIEVTISGILYDKHARTTQQVVLIGEGTLTGLGVGGGPIVPPEPPPGGGGGGGRPPGFWGGGSEPLPTPPIQLPIVPVPPGSPNVPPPGSPPLIVPGTAPTHPITPPPAVVMEYPGIGKVVVPQPTQTGTPMPSPQQPHQPQHQG